MKIQKLVIIALLGVLCCSCSIYKESESTDSAIEKAPEVSKEVYTKVYDWCLNKQIELINLGVMPDCKVPDAIKDKFTEEFTRRRSETGFSVEDNVAGYETVRYNLYVNCDAEMYGVIVCADNSNKYFVVTITFENDLISGIEYREL